MFQSNKNRGQKIWSNKSTYKVVFCSFFALILVVLLGLTGPALAILVYGVSSAWPNPDPIIGDPESFARSNAMGLKKKTNAYKKRAPALNAKRSLDSGSPELPPLHPSQVYQWVGLGSPGDCADIEGDPTWKPMNRVSGWVSVFYATSFTLLWSLLWFTNGYKIVSIPMLDIALLPLNLAFFFLAFQLLALGRRHQRSGQEPFAETLIAPAATWNIETLKSTLTKWVIFTAVWRAIILGLVGFIVGTLLGMLTGLGMIYTIIFTVLIVLMGTVKYIAKIYETLSLTEWLEVRQENDLWNSRWVQLLGTKQPPRFIIAIPHEDNENIGSIVFQSPSGTTFADWVKYEEPFGQMLDTRDILFSTLPQKDDRDMVVKGGISNTSLKVMWAKTPLSPTAYLKASPSDPVSSFSLKIVITKALRETKVPGIPICSKITVLTNPRANASVIESLWHIEGVTIEQLWKVEDRLAELIGVPWLRIGYRKGRSEGISIIFCSEVPKFADKDWNFRHDAVTIDDLNWQHTFRQLKLSITDSRGFEELTTPESPVRVVEASWMLPPSMSYADFSERAPAIAEKLNANWALIGQRLRFVNGEIRRRQAISVIYATSSEDNLSAEPIYRDQESFEFTEQLKWGKAFRDAGLGVKNSGFVPELMSRHENTIKEGVVTYTLGFYNAPGWDLPDLSKQAGKLKALMGLAYIEVLPHRSTIKGEKSRADWFSIIAATIDPLDEGYLFKDYADQILFEPEEGKARIDWCVGMGSDGKLIRYSYFEELPHLVVGAGTGQGKSVLVSSMLYQEIHNNDPHDLAIYMVEPKNELQTFSEFPHVRGFVELAAYDTFLEFVKATSNMYAMLVTEMDRRNKLFTTHPKQPKKLQEARLIASEEGPLPDGTPHPLDLPYILVVCEESTDLFCAKDNSDREVAAAGKEFTMNIEWLARKSRSAGIYLVNIAQRPSKASMSLIVRDQSRRLGLGTPGSMNSSQIIIEKSDLADIRTPGRGLISAKSGDYEGFRAFYLRAPSDSSPNDPDDALELFSDLPRIVGRQWASNGEVVDNGPSAEILDDIWG